MNDTERAELAAAIAKHLPGLPAEAVDTWAGGIGLAVAISPSVRLTATWGDGNGWALPGTPAGARPVDFPSLGPDGCYWHDLAAMLAAVRAHLVTALATARADVAAYERALGDTAP